MKPTTVIHVALATAAFAAHAESPLAGVDTRPFVSTKSRAEVQAELQEYKRAGVNPWATSYNHLRNFKSTKTRDEVAAEFAATRNEVSALHGEDSGSSYFAQHGQSQSRDQRMARTDRPATE